MSMTFWIILVLVAVVGFSLSGNFIKSALFSFAYGGVGLGVIHIAMVLGYPIIILTPQTIAVGLLLGLPGVIAMITLSMIGFL